MSKSLQLASASAGAGLLSFFTLLLPPGGALAHLGENATWGLIIGAVVLALLAMDGAKEAPTIRVLVGAGVAAAAVRAVLVFVL